MKSLNVDIIDPLYRVGPTSEHSFKWVELSKAHDFFIQSRLGSPLDRLAMDPDIMLEFEI